MLRSSWSAGHAAVVLTGWLAVQGPCWLAGMCCDGAVYSSSWMETLASRLVAGRTPGATFSKKNHVDFVRLRRSNLHDAAMEVSYMYRCRCRYRCWPPAAGGMRVEPIVWWRLVFRICRFDDALSYFVLQTRGVAYAGLCRGSGRILHTQSIACCYYGLSCCCCCCTRAYVSYSSTTRRGKSSRADVEHETVSLKPSKLETAQVSPHILVSGLRR